MSKKERLLWEIKWMIPDLTSVLFSFLVRSDLIVFEMGEVTFIALMTVRKMLDRSMMACPIFWGS